jgi:hypothetical protein
MFPPFFHFLTRLPQDQSKQGHRLLGTIAGEGLARLQGPWRQIEPKTLRSQETQRNGVCVASIEFSSRGIKIYGATTKSMGLLLP